MDSPSSGEEVDQYIQRGDELFSQQNIRDSIREYKKALSIDQDNVLIHYKIGVAYQELGTQEQESAFFILAESSYKKAFHLLPHAIATHIEEHASQNTPIVTTEQLKQYDEQFVRDIHSKLIALCIQRGTLDELGIDYSERLKVDPQNKICSENLKKISALAMMSIPEKAAISRAKSSTFLKVIEYSVLVFVILLLIIGFMVPQLKFLFSLSFNVFILYFLFKITFLFFGKKQQKRNQKQW